jgi:acyl-CoA thioester hydrolase
VVTSCARKPRCDRLAPQQNAARPVAAALARAAVAVGENARGRAAPQGGPVPGRRATPSAPSTSRKCMENEHRVAYKVYYEDTDSLGVVYYANYLKFLERGRTEFVGARGRPIQDWNRDGYNFVVYELSMKFKRPGRLGDLLEVVSSFKLDTTYRGRFVQRVECRNELLVQADVQVVCVDAQQQLREFPAL